MSALDHRGELSPRSLGSSGALAPKMAVLPRNAPPETPIVVAPLPAAVDRMITTRQAAAILAISVDTLKKWRVRRKGPNFVRYHDGAIRYKLSTVMKYIEDREVVL